MASVNVEEYPQTDIILRGTDGNECEAFVAAIQELAFVRRKDDDPHWMLRYARTRLRGKAMRWYAKLDPSIRNDWNLFVQAMFEEYLYVEERDRDGIATPVWTSTTFGPAFSSATLPETPASHGLSSTNVPQVPTGANEISSPMRDQAVYSQSLASGSLSALSPAVYDPSVPGPHMGRLRVVYQEDASRPRYICCSYDASKEFKNVTLNAEEALIVSFVPFSEPHEILCMVQRFRIRCERRLAVMLFRVDVAEYHPIVSTSECRSPTTFTTWSANNRCQQVSKIWNVLTDGTLQVTLADLSVQQARDSTDMCTITPNDAYLTTNAYVDISGEMIYLTRDHRASCVLHPDSSNPLVRARIVFEPL